MALEPLQPPWGHPSSSLGVEFHGESSEMSEKLWKDKSKDMCRL